MNASSQTRMTPTFDERLLACPLCDCPRIRPYDVDYTGRTIDRCTSCGVMFMNPQYTDDYLDGYYRNYIGVATCDDDVSSPGNAARRLIHQHYMSLIEEHCKTGKFLSVGCGDGLEIGVARERGWEAEGFDVSPEATAALSERLNVKVLSGDFRDAPYAADHFDCIYLHQVLEHPKTPQHHLTKIRAILKPGGVVFIACPNVRSVSSRLKTFAGKLRLKKRRGKHYDTWHHVFYYSPGVLESILERCYGFRVIHIENGFGDKARNFSDDRIRREIRWNRYLPCWKDVFVLIATKAPIPDGTSP